MIADSERHILLSEFGSKCIQIIQFLQDQGFNVLYFIGKFCHRFFMVRTCQLNPWFWEMCGSHLLSFKSYMVHTKCSWIFILLTIIWNMDFELMIEILRYMYISLQYTWSNICIKENTCNMCMKKGKKKRYLAQKVL